MAKRPLATAAAADPYAAGPAVPATRERARADRQLLHGPAVASHVYARQIKVVADDAELQQTAFGHAADVLEPPRLPRPAGGNARHAGPLGPRPRGSSFVDRE